MGVNKYQPYIYVLPEDDADRQLANGFHLEINLIRQMQILPEAGGWMEVLRRFEAEHIIEMKSNVNAFMILLFDFDERLERLEKAKAIIPPELAARVFVIGPLDEPEYLKKDLPGSFETIGSDLAKDCRQGTYMNWECDSLKHNKSELDRLREHVRPILF